MDLVSGIIRDIKPGIVPASTRRLDKKCIGHSRPVCVSMDTKKDASLILRNKSRYSGTVKIFQDQTLKQRNQLRDLQSKLKALKGGGENDKTIRYINGVPRIVEFKPRTL